jgi:hypothetical protein
MAECGGGWTPSGGLTQADPSRSHNVKAIPDRAFSDAGKLRKLRGFIGIICDRTHNRLVKLPT